MTSLSTDAPEGPITILASLPSISTRPPDSTRTTLGWLTGLVSGSLENGLTEPRVTPTKAFSPLICRLPPLLTVVVPPPRRPSQMKGPERDEIFAERVQGCRGILYHLEARACAVDQQRRDAALEAGKRESWTVGAVTVAYPEQTSVSNFETAFGAGIAPYLDDARRVGTIAGPLSVVRRDDDPRSRPVGRDSADDCPADTRASHTQEERLDEAAVEHMEGASPLVTDLNRSGRFPW